MKLLNAASSQRWKWLTLHIDGVCTNRALTSSEEWRGHIDITGVLPSIRHSKWVEGEVKSVTICWCHTPIGVGPCDGSRVGRQSLSRSDSGCAGEGVGLASSEGTSWRGDGGCDCEYCRRIDEDGHEYKNISNRLYTFCYVVCSHKSTWLCVFCQGIYQEYIICNPDCLYSACHTGIHTYTLDYVMQDSLHKNVLLVLTFTISSLALVHYCFGAINYDLNVKCWDVIWYCITILFQDSRKKININIKHNHNRYRK